MATPRRGILIAGAAAVFLAILLGIMMGRRLSYPIRNLTDTTLDMGSGNLSVRAELKGHDEISVLAHQFNVMEEKL